MGIFQDFLDSRPMTIQLERIARREIEALRNQGDTEAPTNYVGRTGWAILKVLSLTQCAMPPAVGELLGYLPQDIDYQRVPISPDTARVIANQIAIDDLNVGLELDILIHLDLCPSQPGEMCLNTPPAPLPWTSPVFTINDPIHEWAAYNQLDLIDTDTVTLVPDTGTLDVNLTAIDDVDFAENIFNGLPAFRFRPPAQQLGFSSASAVSLFPSERGTVVWVGQVNEFVNAIKGLWNLSGVVTGGLFLRDAGDTSLITADTTSDGQIPIEDDNLIEQLPSNVSQIMILMKDSDTSLRFRRNGVEKQGATITSSAAGAGTLFLGYPSPADANTIDHEVAMFQIYDRVLSAGEMTTVESELASAFGVTLE